MREFAADVRTGLMHKALLYAIQRDKIKALEILLEWSADVDRFYVGSQYCFLRHHENLVNFSHSAEVTGQPVNFEGEVTKARLVEQLEATHWRKTEAEELFEVLRSKVGNGGKVLRREQLLAFNPTELRLTFDEMDHTRDGNLDTGELENGLKPLGLDKSELHMLFASIDTNDDRTISKDEFIHFQMNYWLYRQRAKRSSNAMRYVKAAECWQDLIEHSRETCEHFNHLYCKVREDNKGSDHDKSQEVSKWEEGVKKQVRRARDLGCPDGSPLHPDTRQMLYKHQHALKFKEQEDHGIHIERSSVYKKLNLLESIYIDLLGNDFRYRLGIQVF
jgi:hypothetical protein